MEFIEEERIRRIAEEVEYLIYHPEVSAAPKRCPSRGAIPTLDVAQGLFGEPWQIHLRPHTTSMSAIIAAFVSGLERRRWGRHRRHHSRSL